MNQKIITKQHLEGTAIISFSIAPSDWLQIQERKYFNFDEGNFEIVPPTFFESGSLFLIADQDKAIAINSGEIATIHPNQWTIFRIELDGVFFETFISLRVAGLLPGSIEEAVLDFAVKKSTAEQGDSEESKTSLKKLFTDFFGLSQSGNANEFNSKNLIISAVADLIGAKEEPDLAKLIEEYLQQKNIPATKEKETYSFHIQGEGAEWEVVIELEKKKIFVFSFAPFKSQLDTDLILSEDLNVVNQENSTGHFGIDKEQNILYLRSELVVNSLSKPGELEPLIVPIFESMNAIMLLLQEKYKDSFLFV
jgi:hypothetical protein